MFRLPKTRRDFWIEKISNNQKRDERNIAELSKFGWRVLEVWECSIKGRGKLQPDELIEEVSKWVTGDSSFKRLEGSPISASAKNQF